MRTNLIQTAIHILNDDQGINSLAWYNLVQLVRDDVGEEAAKRLNNLVNVVDNRFFIDIDDKSSALKVHDYLLGYADYI